MTHRFTKAAGSLLIVDIQVRLCAAMPQEKLQRMLNRTRAAIESAKALGFPIVVTEQYPKGLGPSHEVVARGVPDFSPIEKIEFSALVPEVLRKLAPRPNVLVVGMESHVCVFQTVRALKEAGLSPFVAVDAVLSRTDVDCQTGLELCREAGGLLTTVEAALFDALGNASGPEFKAVSAAVK